LSPLLLAALLATEDRSSEDPEIIEVIEVESGVLLTDDEKEAARELADERFEEQRFLGAGALHKDPEIDLYVNPVKALAVDPLHLDKIDPSDFDIPVEVNDSVTKWMRYFLGRGRKWTTRYLERAGKYHPMMKRMLADAGMPLDLVYLSMIESGYSNQARSVASAVGLWQFMAPTGRAYGLRIDYWADERVDPEKSTASAIAYLSDLYELWGDWYLAWASYNAGPGRVNGAVKKHGTKDWWVIASHDTLADETREYVPKLIAAAIVGRNAERYGFVDLEPLAELRYQSVEVAGAVTLDVIADCAGVGLEEIEALNPSLLRGSTPPQGTTEVRIPEGTFEAFSAAFEKIPPSERISYRRHRVQRGENLGGIARSYGVDPAEVARLNRIEDANRIYVGMELVIPVAGSEGPPPAKPLKTTTVHTVRSGDTLAAIATRYNVRLEDLVAWNNLGDADHITVGQKLTIRGGSPQKTAQLTYTVRKGDTLIAIAERFGVTVSMVMDWNGIRDPNAIQPGQVIKLYGPSDDWLTYTVQSGDSLGRIASNHDVSVSDIKSWNDLTGSTIYPGQKLRIRKD